MWLSYTEKELLPDGNYIDEGIPHIKLLNYKNVGVVFESKDIAIDYKNYISLKSKIIEVDNDDIKNNKIFKDFDYLLIFDKVLFNNYKMKKIVIEDLEKKVIKIK